MGKMVPLIGKEATEKYFLHVFVLQCSNPGYLIRRKCVKSLGDFCAVVGMETTEKYLVRRKKKIDSPIPFRPVFPVGKEKENLKKNSHELLQVDPFVKLCQDDYWEVRACCPAVAVPVSCTCSLEKRKTVLADAYAELLLEIEPHVRCSAYVFLGAFICTFADPSITKLDYNENGKLIFVSQEGYEFR